uniref:ATP-binding protein n=1 Tax=Candidatus Methanomethylicus mesodigestus TaxID=1867258 RepID=A0A7C3ERG6_9CREN
MWIVSGSKNDHVRLVSSKKVDAILPIGSYLTVEDDTNVKHVLIVEESYQRVLFEPSPLIADTDLSIMKQDQECKNEVFARKLRQFPLRDDGLFSFIKPNEKARRTTQEEIDEIFSCKDGFPVFLATNYLEQCLPLKDDNKKIIYVRIPFHSLYLQTMICGQTGSGKTVAMKYLMEQFLKHEMGAILAINVKSTDLLTMDQKTEIKDKKLYEQTKAEWVTLGFSEKDAPEFQFSVYVPFTNDKKQIYKEGVTADKIRLITLRTRDLEPTALLGVLQNITDRAAEALPNIFRYWKVKAPKTTSKFREFISWFDSYATKENRYEFPTLSNIGEESVIPLHPGTCDAIKRSLESASPFFDSPEGDSLPIQLENIMVQGKLSVIDLSNKDTMIFGAVLLRHLLSKIYEAKAVKKIYSMPVLIVIDEVHQFYNSTASAQALEELNAIARMGRSERIGVIFASQNPEDLPEGLTSIVNTRVFFRSLGNVAKKFDISGGGLNVSTLENGYAIMSNFAIPQVKFVKFPIPMFGVSS